MSKVITLPAYKSLRLLQNVQDSVVRFEKPQLDPRKLLIALTHQTNIVALDKTLAAIRRASTSHAAAAARVGSIGERMIRAARETGLCVASERKLQYA